MLPKISIITVSLNAGLFIERAILSVLDQNYPNLEYIIIDGGSSDNTVEIIKKYSSQLAYWHSQPDGGAATGQNIGLTHATGDIVGFVFADDQYELGTFAAVAKAFVENPYADLITCYCRVMAIDAKNGKAKLLQSFKNKESYELSLTNVFDHSFIGARFFKKELLDRVGHLNSVDAASIYNCANDNELMLRIVLSGAKNIIVPHLGYTYFAHDKSNTFARHLQGAALSHIETVKRIRHEHVLMCKQVLAKGDITATQKKILERMHCEQLIRLLLCEIYLKQWKSALQLFKNSYCSYGVKLFFFGGKIIGSAFYNRLFFFFRNKATNFE